MKILLLVLLLSVAACDKADDVVGGQDEPRAGNAESVFDPLVETMDQADAVDDLSRQRSEGLNRAIDAAD